MEISTLQNIDKLRDPKFYLEKFCKIKGKKQGSLIPFVLNEAQKDLFNTLKWESRVIICKARQIGFSTAVVSWMYHNTITNPGTTTAIIGYNSQLTAELLEKVKTLHKSTPPELRPTLHTDNKWEISFPRIDSKILVLSSTDNVGHGYTLHNVLCVSGETEIFIENGFTKKVKDVVDGEYILNGKGGLAKVKKVIKKKNDKKLLRLKIVGNDDLVVTEDHKILVRGNKKDGFKPIWKKAKDLIAQKDRIGYPYFQCRNIYNKIIIPNVINEKYLSRSSINNVSNKIDIDYNFGLFVGWYLAEGSIRRNQKGEAVGICLSIHRNEEKEVLEMINNSIRKNVQKVSVSYNNKSKTAIVNFYSKNFSQFILDKFGDGCSNKILNDCVWRWNPKFSYGLLLGLFKGDGFFNDIRKVQLTSVNKQLIYQVKKLLISLRIGMPSIRHFDTKRYDKDTKHRYDLVLSGKGNYKFRKKFNLEVPVYDNGRGRWLLETNTNINQGRGTWRKGRKFFWSKINNILEAENEDYVYDIVMEKSPHSFLTKSGVVHNCTELSLWEKQEEKMIGLDAAVPIGGHLVVESTPRGLGNYYARLWFDKESSFVKKEYGWEWGYTDEEIEIIKKRTNNPRLFSQEYDLAFLASGLSVFDMDRVQKHRKNILKIGDKVKDGNNEHTVCEEDGWIIYKRPNPNHYYVCGADPADGVDGGDYSAAVIIDRTTGEEVAFFHAYLPQDIFGKKLNDTARKYNNALMVVEMNSGGPTMMTLKNLLYPSIYFRPAKFENLGESISEKIGWRTTRINRQLLINDFDKAFRDDALILHSEILLNEMLTFVYDKNGDMNAESTYHDDVIFAIAVALQGFKMMFAEQPTQLDYAKYLPKNFSY